MLCEVFGCLFIELTYHNILHNNFNLIEKEIAPDGSKNSFMNIVWIFMMFLLNSNFIYKKIIVEDI